MRLITILALALLSACGAPSTDLAKTGKADASVLAAPMVEEAQVVAAPATPTENCVPGDGIGGTGCPVD